MPDAIFWVVWIASGLPVPVMGTNTFNLYVQLPGRDALAVVPRSRVGVDYQPIL
jgi:hypothetical protein